MFFFGDFVRTAVGKKAVVAVTGIVLFGYVLLHMLGNLKFFQGPAALNEYAAWLRVIGYPLLPHGTLLWAVRIVLLVAIALHVWYTAELTWINWQARPSPYVRHRPQESTLASRTMRVTGLIVLVFLVYHLAHFTFGTAHPEFAPHDVYHNVTVGFQVPWTAAFYLLAQAALGVHLWHGLWSLFQTLGWNHPRFNPGRRYFAWFFAVLIALGMISVPLAVQWNTWR